MDDCKYLSKYYYILIYNYKY
jgi:hypothetical protein